MNFQEIGRFEAAGRAALGEYGMEQWKFELLHCSENATFLVTEPESGSGDLAAGGALNGGISTGGARKRVMRVARPGYHTLEELESEIRWVEKIWEEQVIPVARPVRNRRGDGVTVVAWQPETVDELDDGFGTGLDTVFGVGTVSEDAGVGVWEVSETLRDFDLYNLSGAPGKSCNRFACVMFEFLPGHAPDPKHDACALEDFREIGRMAAKLHEQVIHWPESETLSRPHWDYEHMLGTQGLFGDWRLCRELDESGFQIIRRVCEKIRENLTNYGKSRENYGLIHSDLRAANLLKDEHCIHAIDFDDSGFGWFLYDAAAAISFVEDDERAGEWLRSWVSGYREVRPLPPEEVRLIPTFVMARRIQLMAWITSHDDSDPVKVYYRGFAEETVKMGERFLLDCPDFQ